MSTSCSTATSVQCVACKAQVDALSSIVTTFSAIANTFEQTDYSFRNAYFNNNPAGSPTTTSNIDTNWLNAYCSAQGAGSGSTKCCRPGTPNCQSPTNPFGTFSPYSDPTPGSQGTNVGPSTPTINQLYWTYSIGPTVNSTNFLNIAIEEYVQTVSTAVNTYVNTQGNNAPMSNPELAKARDFGWILAGGYYYFVSQANGQNLQSAIPPINFAPPDASPETAGGQYGSYRVNYSAAAILEKQLASAATTAEEHPSKLPLPLLRQVG